MTERPHESGIRLDEVTMLEAVQTLRERGVYVQFEREPLTEEVIDRSRPVVDSRRRFSVQLDSAWPPAEMVGAVAEADGGYDAVGLTEAPATFLIFPRSGGPDRFAASALAWKVEPLSTEGRPLAEVLERLGLVEHGITVFDRAGFLTRALAPRVETAGRPAYQVLGELFAGAGTGACWTLGGFSEPGRTLSIGVVPGAGSVGR
jgi:hypothetical protein